MENKRVNVKTTLTRNGYRINKKLVDVAIINKYKKELTVKPFSFEDQDIPSYTIYKETPGELIVPRYFGIEKMGVAVSSIQHEKNDLNFVGELRDFQVDIVGKSITFIRENGGGIISVGCGRGKTVMALKIACELKVKTLVIVHKTFLQDQWFQRAQQFTNARIGIIRQNKIQVKNKDIVIGMIQSISMKEYNPTIFSDFGLVIYDECHHVASRIFSNALYKTGATYTLGLSATPERLDGLSHVMHWYIGQFIHREKAKKNKQVVAKIFNYTSNDQLFREKKKWFKGAIKPDAIKMITNLCALKQRTYHIVNIINQIRKFPERKILILSGRKSHLTDIKARVDEAINKDIDNEVILQDECKTHMYTGDSNKAERQLAEASGDILFATFDLAHEGLDIERLNTIILATPKKNIVQSVGRIMRKVLKTGDVRPLIIDFADMLSSFKNQAEIRQKHYKQSKYKIEQYYLKHDKVITFDTYMSQEQNMKQEEIEQMEDRVVYLPNLESILDMQRVEDPSIGDYYDDKSDQSTNTNETDDTMDDDDPNIQLGNRGKIMVKAKVKNATYMF